jgi:hypothetical protein
MFYYSEILRNPTLDKGPGWWTLYTSQTNLITSNIQAIASWPCITGGAILDPKEYGGIIPPVAVQMVTDIYPHVETGRPELDFAQIIPINARFVQEKYPLRTWYNEGDWFKIHPMGVSTGCIGPTSEYWEYCKEQLNLAVQHALANDYIFQIVIKDQLSMAE